MLLPSETSTYSVEIFDEGHLHVQNQSALLVYRASFRNTRVSLEISAVRVLDNAINNQYAPFRDKHSKLWLFLLVETGGKGEGGRMRCTEISHLAKTIFLLSLGWIFYWLNYSHWTATKFFPCTKIQLKDERWSAVSALWFIMILSCMIWTDWNEWRHVYLPEHSKLLFMLPFD